MRSTKKATIRDVARAAGVSPATVSRFLNGSLSLPVETATRVQHAVDTLNYQPSALARSLSLGQSRMIGLVVPDIANPFFAQLASAAEAEAYKHGYGLLLCSTGGDSDREIAYIRLLKTRQLDGLIFVTDHDCSIQELKVLSHRAPIVLVDEDVRDVIAPRLFVDNHCGGRMVTEHLLAYGHTRIGFVGAKRTLLSGRERYQGFAEALSERGLEPRQELLHFGSYSESTGEAGLAALLRVPQPPTAIFAGNDTIAVGVILEARRRGLRIPQDLSLVGFDGIPITALLSPALTTVVQPIKELGRLGVNMLLNSLNQDTEVTVQVRLPVSLAVRASVATPGQV